MDFIQYISDQEKTLTSHKYVEMLYCKLKEKLSMNVEIRDVEIRDEEIYRKHIPLDFPTFLQTCVSKLRDLKKQSQIDWVNLNEQYLSTLILYVFEDEDLSASEDALLYASNLFLLINTFDIPRQHYFYEVTYLKILKVLKDAPDTTNNIIMSLIDDLKEFLIHFDLPDDLINATVSVLHNFSYCNINEFQTFSTDVALENLGYKAFISLQILVQKFGMHRNADKKLFPILLALTSSLKNSSSNKLSRSVQVAHQRNVRLFIRENFALFTSRNFCLVTDMLKFVCFSSKYDEYEAISKLIQQLPVETNQNFITFFSNAMVGDVLDLRKNLLNLVLLILKNYSEHETMRKRQVRTEIFLLNVIKLLADKDEEVHEKALKIIALSSEESMGQKVLKRIMNNTTGDINRHSIFHFLNKMVNLNWRKRHLNVNYINLVCNLLQLDEELITIKVLNKLRNVALSGSPNDVKPCIGHLKKLIIVKSDYPNVVMYVLSIFIKQALDPMATSTVFVKELHDLIFSNISIGKNETYVWNIVNYLISNNFDVLAIFDRFRSLNLLKENYVRILMEYKIHENTSHVSALKLLCILLHYAKYEEHHCLDEKIEQWINATAVDMSSTELSLVVYALNKILDKKTPNNCASQRNRYRDMYTLIKEAFVELKFPVNCVKYVIVLMSNYSRLLQLDEDSSDILKFEETLQNKLKDVLDENLIDQSYLIRDVVCVNELIFLHNAQLSPTTFNLLRNIVSNITSKSNESFNNNQEVWGPCLLLYIKNCFVNSDLISNCATHLEMILRCNNDTLKLQILYGLFDICAFHLQYYDPIIPHLFSSLYSNNTYVRFVSCKLLMKLINDGQLRLMEGQYFLFMGLLADEKDVIARSVEVFIKDKFVKNHHQTVAKYFVASIVHYNLCYDHPSISLTSEDQSLLKKRVYSSSDRFTIYAKLFQFLPDSSKFSILNQMSVEILSRIVNKSIPRTAEVLQILGDALKIILLVVSNGRIGEINNDKEFYRVEIENVENDLLVRDILCLEGRGVLTEQGVILKRLLKCLFELLYGSLSQDAKFCQNLLFTITVLTKGFYPMIKRLINEEGSNLKVFYRDIKNFYVTMKDQFEFCLLSLNPSTLNSIIEKEDREFYIEEFTNFALIPPHIIFGL